MTPSNSPEPTPLVVQIVVAAVAASNVVYLVLGVLLKLYVFEEGQGFTEMPEGALSILGPVLLVVGAASSFGSIPFCRLLEPRFLAAGDGIQARLRLLLVSMAVAESGAIMGLVYVMLSGRLNIPLVLWGCALAASIHHFPSRAWLEAGSRREEP